MVNQINAATKSGKIPEEVRAKDKHFSKWDAEMTPGNHHGIVQAFSFFTNYYYCYYYLQVEYENSSGSLSFRHLYLHWQNSTYGQSLDIINITNNKLPYRS
jgi:hypothetical protein